MNRPRPQAAIPFCIALLLSACGGGSGSALLQSSPPPAAPPPPPPPPPSDAGEPCPPPITGPCVIEGRYTLTFDEYGMSGGRQSDDRLFVHGGQSGGGWVNLRSGEYRFAGGTEIAGTSLVVWDRLVSDVQILRDYTGWGFIGGSELWLLGTVQGNVRNDALLNVRCASGIHPCSAIPQQRIDGDYTQLANGVMEVTLGRHLQVTGRAILDGVLRLTGGGAQYVLPTAPAAVPVLHADGGVSGAFAGWHASGLFLEGALRYTANDVFFDATRISLAKAAAASGSVHPLGVASAANLDRALAGADRFALAPASSLDDAQQRFLASAASLLWLQDMAQAARSFDSLAGHAHAEVYDLPHMQAAQVAAGLDARLARQAHADGPMPWGDATDVRRDGHLWDGRTSGVDLWLSPRLLVGGSLGDGRNWLQVDRSGGDGTGKSPMAGAHAHYRGDGWHATGVLVAGRTRLLLQRPIELGAAGSHVVHSQRGLQHLALHVEAGRDLLLGDGRLSPFASLDYSLAHGDAFAEQGGTGFELVAGPSRQSHLSGAMGARYARDWRFGAQRLRLDLEARHRRDFGEGDPLLAAFRGVPDVQFELPTLRDRSAAELRMGLGGWIGAGTQWSMDYRHEAGGSDRERAWSIGLRHAF